MSKQEVEICFPLKNVAAVRTFLDKNAKFSYENRQIDTYYDSAATGWTKSVDSQNPIYFWLRVREEGDVASINFKDFSRDHRTDVASCAEFESVVQNPHDVKQILEQLSFTPVVTVDKTRRAYKFRDAEIVLDNIVGLGDNIEIEYYGDQSDVDEIRGYLHAILTEIGAEIGEKDTLGYPHRLLMKQRDVQP
jgi:predicted adenylyl cyclase CyaB